MQFRLAEKGGRMGGLACSNGSMCPSLGSGNTVVFSDAEVATHDSEPECVNLYISILHIALQYPQRLLVKTTVCSPLD